ncbi:hypothetical protein [Jiella marina]|uniref:hypothetical protein n=1 Tax=Jiella sp. LLJ827 TaxID=2917712 RepID=UPI002100C88D|nr:hypothetical protein [Jiella sp. LLJ827]MCQ0986433.1 hypothetical protein [Jiella sp. LLJ827]
MSETPPSRRYAPGGKLRETAILAYEGEKAVDTIAWTATPDKAREVAHALNCLAKDRAALAAELAAGMNAAPEPAAETRAAAAFLRSALDDSISALGSLKTMFANVAAGLEEADPSFAPELKSALRQLAEGLSGFAEKLRAQGQRCDALLAGHAGASPTLRQAQDEGSTGGTPPEGGAVPCPPTAMKVEGPIYLVWNTTESQCVGFLDAADALWTATGADVYAQAGKPTIGADFRHLYARRPGQALPMLTIDGDHSPNAPHPELVEGRGLQRTATGASPTLRPSTSSGSQDEGSTGSGTSTGGAA